VIAAPKSPPRDVRTAVTNGSRSPNAFALQTSFCARDATSIATAPVASKCAVSGSVSRAVGQSAAMM
jgi:hypothetical protein